MLDGTGIERRELGRVGHRLRSHKFMRIAEGHRTLESRGILASRRRSSMVQPPTLLQMQGAPMHPAPFADAALILIDIQEEYRSGALPLDGITQAALAAGEVLALARSNVLPIFHVRHTLPGAPIFNPGSPTFAFMPEVAPQAGETIIDKSRPNAFHETGLDRAIRQTGRSELIIVGMQTHLCVSATVRAAGDLGYRSTVVRSACATRDLPDGKGGAIPAPLVHDAALAELGDAFAVIADCPSAWGRAAGPI